MADAEEYVTQTELQRRYGLTASLSEQLGEPDFTFPNPYYRGAAPMKLYAKARIERWIAEHSGLVQAAQARKKASAKGVATKRESLRREVAAQIAQFQMYPAPAREILLRQAWDYYSSRFADFDGVVTERALCAYVRHNYTNYRAMLAATYGRVGTAEIYRIVKALLTCRVVQEYRLRVHPLYAAFGDEFRVLFPQLAERAPEEIEGALRRMIEDGNGAS